MSPSTKVSDATNAKGPAIARSTPVNPGATRLGASRVRRAALSVTLTTIERADLLLHDLRSSETNAREAILFALTQHEAACDVRYREKLNRELSDLREECDHYKRMLENILVRIKQTLAID